MFETDVNPETENQEVDEPVIPETEGEQVTPEPETEATPEPAQEEEKAFAEKYGVPFHDEANLVKGYKELQAMATRNAQENAEMRGILKTLAERQGTSQSAVAEEPDIESYYADEPAILPLAKELKQLRRQVGDQELQVGRQAAVEVAKFTDEFFEANPILKTNPAVLQEFLDDLNDRLPGFRFQDLYQGAVKGDTLNPAYAPEIKRKIVAAYKSVTRGASEKAEQKKVAAKQKADRMSDTLPPKATEAKPATADLSKMSSAEIARHIRENYK